MENCVEIERKYIIAKPSVDLMQNMEGFFSSAIEQTYLASAPHVTHRVRSRTTDGKAVFTETKKIRIDKISAFEDEHEISREEYLSLLKNTAKGTVTVRKTRYAFSYEGQVFEVDVYPEWAHTAIMETELPSRDKQVKIPPFISIIREVSGMWEYSNAAFSRSFPEEDKI